MTIKSITETCDWLQHSLRLDGPFFDKDGVLLGCINSRTMQPFTKEWTDTQTPLTPPEPYGVDYVASITY